LTLDGCTCVSLGTQTPLTDIVQAAQAHRADVVALSFSNMNKTAVVQTSLRELRARLPTATALWVGGTCTALYQWPLSEASAVQHLSGLQPLVAQWRHAH
jgi:methylmalonyl-CoA mutase cobalamin-binding subunit